MLNIHYITVSYNYINHITIKNILKTSLLPQKLLKSRITAQLFPLSREITPQSLLFIYEKIIYQTSTEYCIYTEY